MERIEPSKEEWVPLGTDDDGTQAFLDVKSVTRDLDATSIYRAWVKHVLPSGSRTYSEILSLLRKAKKNKASPDHVKQVIEIDCMKDVSRNLHLVVCDKQSRILDVISFRFPEWSEIKERSILEKVQKSIKETFPDAIQIPNEPLQFRRPRVAVKPVDMESAEVPVLSAAPGQEMPGPSTIQSAKLKLQQADVVP